MESHCGVTNLFLRTIHGVLHPIIRSWPQMSMMNIRNTLQAKSWIIVKTFIWLRHKLLLPKKNGVTEHLIEVRIHRGDSALPELVFRHFWFTGCKCSFSQQFEVCVWWLRSSSAVAPSAACEYYLLKMPCPMAKENCHRPSTWMKIAPNHCIGLHTYYLTTNNSGMKLGYYLEWIARKQKTSNYWSWDYTTIQSIRCHSRS